MRTTRGINPGYHTGSATCGKSKQAKAIAASMASDQLSNESEPTVFAAGYLVFRNAQRLEFLLMKHPDRWDLPKGHLDEGENCMEAAKRELFEETGIPIDAIWTDPQYCFVHRYWVAKRKKPEQKTLKELTIFLGLLLRPIELVCSEHPDYKWWDWNPPHDIQSQTIDPLLESVAKHFQEHPQSLAQMLKHKI